MEDNEKQRSHEGIFSVLRAQRPVDTRIPKYWRDGFENFTGLQPTYDEYIEDPNMWQADMDVSQRVKFVFIVLTIILGIICLSDMMHW